MKEQPACSAECRGAARASMSPQTGAGTESSVSGCTGAFQAQPHLRATYWFIFLLHPAVFFVGIQLSRQPDGFQTFHKGGGKYFHEHVRAGSQQTLQRWPDRETLWTCWEGHQKKSYRRSHSKIASPTGIRRG